jgi:hypothetical protein
LRAGISVCSSTLRTFFSFHESARRFCAVNADRWKKVLPRTVNADQSILVDSLGYNAGHNMKTAIVANMLKREKKVRTLWITRHAYHRKQLRIIASYGADGVIRIPVLRHPILLLRSIIKAYGMYRSTALEHIMKLRYRGIVIGDLVWDTYLRDTGSGTIFRKDLFLLRKMVEATFFTDIYERLIKRYGVRYIVLSHKIYSQYGIPARVGLKHGAEIYVTQGFTHSNIIIRKYDSPDTIMEFESKVPQELFARIYENHRETAVKYADIYLENLTGGAKSITGDEIKEGDICEPFSRSRRQCSKTELAEALGLDINKPFVYVMANVFTDGPHSNGWFLFRDVYSMIYKVTEHIRDIKNINWILKDHPYNMHPFFGGKHNIQGIAREIYGETLPENIVILPADISTTTVFRTADGIVTGFGSVGFEAPCFGIRCLTAGDAPYTDLGTTVDPKTEDEFLGHLHTLFENGKPHAVDIDRAKTAVFIYYTFMRVHISVIPDMESITLSEEADIAALSEAERLLGEKELEDHYWFTTIEGFFREGAMQLTNDLSRYE